MNEASVQAAIRLEASQKGLRLFRNNCGAGFMRNGSFIRFGLANDSTAVNAVIKSADLIGIRPVVIEQWMVGHILGIFCSVECKASDWKPDNSDRYKAQLAWQSLIQSYGGEAHILNQTGSL